jgi:pectinesterase inhibitor-like protein
MARLTITATAFFAVAFFLAVAGAGATEARVPHHNGANTNMYIFSQGRKVSAGTSVSVPQRRNGVNTDEYILARKLAGTVTPTQACDQLDGNKKVCYTIAKLAGVTTPRTLLETAVRVALGRARALKATFDVAKATAKTGNPMASILGSCDKNYDDLVGALEEVTRSLQKGKTGDLVSKMTAASTYATDCDNWYSERSLTSPYEAVQRHTAQAVSVALGVAATSKNL